MIIFLNRVDKKSVFGGFYKKKIVIIKKKYGNILRYVSEIIKIYLYLFVEGFFPTY